MSLLYRRSVSSVDNHRPGDSSPNGPLQLNPSAGGFILPPTYRQKEWTVVQRIGGTPAPGSFVDQMSGNSIIDLAHDDLRNNGADEYPASHLYPGHSFGLGFTVITDPGQSQVISSKGEYSWGGAANTKFWIDPEEDLVAVLMSQFLGSPWSDETRYNMKIATYQALTELGAD